MPAFILCIIICADGRCSPTTCDLLSPTHCADLCVPEEYNSHPLPPPACPLYVLHISSCLPPLPACPSLCHCLHTPFACAFPPHTSFSHTHIHTFVATHTPHLSTLPFAHTHLFVLSLPLPPHTYLSSHVPLLAFCPVPATPPTHLCFFYTHWMPLHMPAPVPCTHTYLTPTCPFYHHLLHTTTFWTGSVGMFIVLVLSSGWRKCVALLFFLSILHMYMLWGRRKGDRRGKNLIFPDYAICIL